MTKARNYSEPTKKKLFALSGNQCAAPTCDNPLISKDHTTVTTEICHIEAASPNGPRYNSLMTDDERRHFNNLLLLCGVCHPIVDNKENEHQYPVELLKEWKKNHESTKTYQLSNNTSLLIKAINVIATSDFEEVDEKGDTEAFDIRHKIEHNQVKRMRPMLEEYKVYFRKINPLYAELELQGSFTKEKLLRNIKQIYLREKGKYLSGYDDEMTAVRIHADDIFEGVEVQLHELAEKHGRSISEDLSFGISVIMTDAFMKCKILEEPPK
ncbi:ABC-three component system protein [Methylotenera sp.]|uniref:ABC-three component system protein n=1 Tax=Methylotenera sp. TaxID=2051956 RepID=UPI00248A6742|nr:ABC-three component system protein [Methylotenera sp.]MDI1298386.1 hypothetical protein [Methylotenera sp.]